MVAWRGVRPLLSATLPSALLLPPPLPLPSMPRPSGTCPCRRPKAGPHLGGPQSHPLPVLSMSWCAGRPCAPAGLCGASRRRQSRSPPPQGPLRRRWPGSPCLRTPRAARCARAWVLSRSLSLQPRTPQLQQQQAQQTLTNALQVRGPRSLRRSPRPYPRRLPPSCRTDLGAALLPRAPPSCACCCCTTGTLHWTSRGRPTRPRCQYPREPPADPGAPLRRLGAPAACGARWGRQDLRCAAPRRSGTPVSTAEAAREPGAPPAPIAIPLAPCAVCDLRPQVRECERRPQYPLAPTQAVPPLPSWPLQGGCTSLAWHPSVPGAAAGGLRVRAGSPYLTSQPCAR